MDTVKAILRHHGYNAVSEVPTGERLRLEVPSGDALVIEKPGDTTVRVTQYDERRGSLQVAHAIVFRVTKADILSEEWLPIEYRHHGLAYATESGSGLPHLEGVIAAWDRVLDRRGFVAEAKEHAAAAVLGMSVSDEEASLLYWALEKLDVEVGLLDEEHSLFARIARHVGQPHGVDGEPEHLRGEYGGQ